MATSFKVKYSKSANQQSITIVRDDNVDLSALTSVVSKAYTDDLATPDTAYTFTAQQVTDLVAGTVTVDTSDLLGSAIPTDDFYTVILEADTATYVSDSAGIGITLEAKYQVYKNASIVDVYAPDYRLSDALHVASILLEVMDSIELQDPSKQKREDYITRQIKLKDMLNY